MEDSIYRRCFIAGILCSLTVGAAWGALLLWRIGVAGNFTIVSVHDVNAHGHAQIFGWVGLVAIMMRGQLTSNASASADFGPAPGHIKAHHRVAAVLHWFAFTQPVFERHGFVAVRNPLLRRTVARGVTIATACALHGVDRDRFLGELNASVASARHVRGAGPSEPRRVELTLVGRSTGPA